MLLLLELLELALLLHGDCKLGYNPLIVEFAASVRVNASPDKKNEIQDASGERQMVSCVGQWVVSIEQGSELY
jgi:hypothetical protein